MMPQRLIFTLAAPLASFGAVAVGERRPTWDRPGKSQVIGLIAAALGIERTEEARLAELAAGLCLAIRIDDPGQLASDYHTTQVPPQKRNRRHATRADEMGVPKHELKTVLSRREFRVGSRHTIAVWYAPDDAEALGRIEAALHTPVFAPYAGRKSFPLMLPMNPRVVGPQSSIQAAFDAYDRLTRPGPLDLLRTTPRHGDVAPPIFVDADAVLSTERIRLEERRDVPESRDKWRFGLRAEALLRPSRANEGGAA